MEITKREIFASITIILVMLSFGFMISQDIDNAVNESNEEYHKALKIEDKEMFLYAMDTSAGNAFVWLEVESVTPQSIPDIEGEFMFIKKVCERYTRHEQTTTDDEGNTETEIYYTWDYYGKETWNTETVLVNGVEFEFSQIGGLSEQGGYGYKYESGSSAFFAWEGDKRYYYSTIDIEVTGSAYVAFKDRTIPEKIHIYEHYSPTELYDAKLNNPIAAEIGFWVGWTGLTAVLIFGFYKLENRWLYNRQTRGK